MKNIRKIIAALLIAVLALAMTSCAGSGTETKTIVMATNAEFEPFEFREDNEFVGIDIEISKIIAEKLGKELEISDIAFDSLIPALQSGKADFVAAGMSVDEDRLKNVDFSEPYFNASQSIIVLKGSDIKSAEDLVGKNIAVQLGTTGAKYCEENVENVTLTRLGKGPDCSAALIAGKVDAVVIDDFPASKLVEKNSDLIEKLEIPLTVETYSIAVLKGNTELLDQINEVIKELQDSGEMDKIFSKYID